MWVSEVREFYSGLRHIDKLFYVGTIPVFVPWFLVVVSALSGVDTLHIFRFQWVLLVVLLSILAVLFTVSCHFFEWRDEKRARDDLRLTTQREYIGDTNDQG